MPLSRFGPARKTDPDRGPVIPGGLAQALLREFPDPIAVADGAGRLLWGNPAFIAFVGREIDPGACVSARVLAGPYADAREGVRLADLVRQGRGRLEATLFDGRDLSRSCELLVLPIEPPAGAATRMLVIRDLDPFQRRSSELAVRADAILREREMLEATARALEVGVIAVDDAERVLLANERARQEFGLDGVRLEGQLLADIALPLVVRGAWLTFIATGVPEEVRRVTLRRSGDRRELALKFVQVRGGHGRILGSVLVLEPSARGAC